MSVVMSRRSRLISMATVLFLFVEGHDWYFMQISWLLWHLTGLPVLLYANDFLFSFVQSGFHGDDSPRAATQFRCYEFLVETITFWWFYRVFTEFQQSENRVKNVVDVERTRRPQTNRPLARRWFMRIHFHLNAFLFFFLLKKRLN